MIIINKLKKDKKIILATVIALIAIIGVFQISDPNTVYANESFIDFSEFLDDLSTVHSWELKTTSPNEYSTYTDIETYLYNENTGETIYAAFGINESGELFEIPLDEYISMIQAEHQNLLKQLDEFEKYFISEKNKYTVYNGEVSPYLTLSWSYHEISRTTGLRSAVRVTPHVIGPATITNGVSETFTDQYGGNINFTAGAKNAIQGGAGFSWNTSASSSANFSQNYNVPSGQRMAVYFSARDNVTAGTLSEVTAGGGIIRHNVIGRSPARVGNFADGVYELRSS